MRRFLAKTSAVGVAVLGVCGVLALLVGRGAPRWTLLRRGGDRIARTVRRQVRHQSGRWRGIRYRAWRRRPDPDVIDNVLADRIRSSLGGLEKGLDVPHIHVMVEDHTALLHGDVATTAQAEQIEHAVAAVSGVRGVESHLHVGLLPSDTRPSGGSHHHPPSEALRRLLGAAVDAGVDDQQARRAVRAVLSTFVERLPVGERNQVTAHLPADVRRLTFAPPHVTAPTRPARTVGDLVARVVAIDGLSADTAEPVVAAVLGELRALVPEEAGDITAVLPQELKQFWQEAGQTFGR